MNDNIYPLIGLLAASFICFLAGFALSARIKKKKVQKKKAWLIRADAWGKNWGKQSKKDE